MRRFLLQFLSFPIIWAVGAFSFVGTQSFLDQWERTFAKWVLAYCGVLFIVAVANFFTAKLFWPHAFLIVGATVIVIAVYAWAGQL
jgi:hypothetical protein